MVIEKFELGLSFLYYSNVSIPGLLWQVVLGVDNRTRLVRFFEA